MSGEATQVPSTVTTYRVDGMTCGHCASAVESEIGQLVGVSAVEVELRAGETSNVTVTSVAPLPADQLAGALEEAGDYRLVPSS